MIETLTFPTALLGFLLLAASAVVASRRDAPRFLLLATALVVVSHVGLVWTYRYSGDITRATRNGYFGFLLFHCALALIVVSPMVPKGKLRRSLTFASFLTVCVGANGAIFRYDVVAPYRVPVIATTVVAIAWIALDWRRGLKRNREGQQAG
ncbi:MAG: hypothetical protein AAF517_25970 [Planctomycetota bacterium]